MERPANRQKTTVEKSQSHRTGSVFVDAMQEARQIGLKLKPIQYYPTYRPPVSFSDEER
jgi:hypothetical protein